MIIGKIDYINLLPFYIFLKRTLRDSGARAALHYHKGVPAKINEAFQKRRIEAAVISSIVSQKFRCSDFGIVANKKVQSVLICPGKESEDKESSTSNVLAKLLGVKGEVVIGDKALLRYKKSNCQDLATLWYEKTKLPFVFARFCYRKRDRLYQQLSTHFLQTPIKIPTYILKRYAKRSDLSQKEVKAYLKLINYKIGPKEKRGLKKFLKMARRVK